MLLFLEICLKYTGYSRNMPLLWEQIELEIVVNTTLSSAGFWT